MSPIIIYNLLVFPYHCNRINNILAWLYIMIRYQHKDADPSSSPCSTFAPPKPSIVGRLYVMYQPLLTLYTVLIRLCVEEPAARLLAMTDIPLIKLTPINSS
jgi:hypothetical protein